MTTLQKHNQDIKDQNYTGVTTRFSGYIQFGEVRSEQHDLIGFTPEFIKKCIELILSPNYLYARQKNFGIALYGKDDSSPTGVTNLGGIPNELEYLLGMLGKTSQLSPTEDLRTAH